MLAMFYICLLVLGCSYRKVGGDLDLIVTVPTLGTASLGWQYQLGKKDAVLVGLKTNEPALY